MHIYLLGQIRRKGSVLENTFGVIGVREIRAVRRAWNECAPECSSNFAFLEPGKVDMGFHPSIFKPFLERGFVYVILIHEPEKNRKIIVTIWNMPAFVRLQRAACDSISGRDLSKVSPPISYPPVPRSSEAGDEVVRVPVEAIVYPSLRGREWL